MSRYKELNSASIPSRHLWHNSMLECDLGQLCEGRQRVVLDTKTNEYIFELGGLRPYWITPCPKAISFTIPVNCPDLEAEIQRNLAVLEQMYARDAMGHD